MKLSTFQAALAAHPDDVLAFVLPGGNAIPRHAHVTEVGRTHKRFLDCGGTRRDAAVCSLQVWVADDVEHRLPAGKLAAILDAAEEILGADDPEMQVECQQGSLTLFAVEAVESAAGTLAFTLAAKHAACLAMDICLPTAEEESCCGSGSSCCG